MRRLTQREKWMVRAVAGAVAAIIVAVVAVSLATPGHSSGHGCIYVTVPAATGAQELNRCGLQARSICATAENPKAFTQQAAQTVTVACRRAGLPVGR